MRISKYEKILLVAANLIAKKGYDGTSFQDIADDVGLHKSSLFHYFKNKEELLLEILEMPIEEVDKSLEKIIANKKLTPEEKLKRAIHSHLSILTKYFDNVTVYLNEVRSLSKLNQAFYIQKRKKYEKNFQRIIAEMKTKGYFNGCDLKITTFGLLGMLNWVAKWYKKDGPLSAKKVGDTFCKIILGQNTVTTSSLNKEEIQWHTET